MARNTIRDWIQASRPPFFIATLIPLAAGWIVAGRLGLWHPWRMFMVLVGAFMVHLATNLANDFFDHIQGADEGRSIGGSRVIQQGKISPNRIMTVVVVLYVLAISIGLYFVFGLDLWGLLPLIVIAGFSSYFYVAPPVRYGYRGLGELSVGVNMGLIMVMGTYWVIAGRIDLLPLFVSIPIGFMVASILYYQSLPDMETDRAAGKYTLAVRLGKRNAYFGFILFWIVIYLSIMTLVLTGCLSWIALLSLVTVPILQRLLYIIRETKEWIELDRYGGYIRSLYFLNGGLILGALL